ncbi:hypothetical protein DL764_000108 [Monosporascus ibericus]|uniref:Uncharacterized protein n=1 Tax=Monosporascus ibericus TaxID=155417 RepID=A0A4Q4TZY2_9PEZI|nr:hypothetical protein DL764_000108 [Monosporascus ibericus]
MPSTTKPPHGGVLASLRTIIDATSSPETAEALLFALAFRFLAVDAIVSFVLITTVAVASADPETFPFAPIRGCSIAHTVVSTLCFAVGATLWTRIYYFKHHPTPLPRTGTGYVPRGENSGSGVGGARMSFDDADTKAEARAFGLQGAVEMDELGLQKSRAASPYGQAQGYQSSSNPLRNLYPNTSERALDYSEYHKSTIPFAGMHPFEVPARTPPLPTSLAHRRSQSGAPPDATTIRHDRSTTPSWTPSDECSVAGFDDIDLFEGAGRPSSRATTIATGRSSFGEESGFLQGFHRGDARRHTELSEGLAGRHGSVRAVVEDVPPRRRDVDSPFTMADATAYTDLFSNSDRTDSTCSTGSQGNWT